MKQLFLRGAAAVAVMAGTTAYAADLPVYVEPVAPAPVVAPVSTWTGFYAGVHAGYGWGDVDYDAAEFDGFDDEDFFDDYNDYFPYEYDTNGWLAGGQLGFNWQFSNFVLGVEGDASWTHMEDDLFYAFDDGPGATGPYDYDVDSSAEINWLASVRARAGFALDRFMVYGTGGVAWAGVEGESTLIDDIGDEFNDSDSATHTGWVAGLGVEAKVTDMVTVRAEYLHYDLGEQDYSFTNDGIEYGGEADVKVDTVRLGVNVLFNGMFN